jgi:hypothetical protein
LKARQDEIVREVEEREKGRLKGQMIAGLIMTIFVLIWSPSRTTGIESGKKSEEERGREGLKGKD